MLGAGTAIAEPSHGSSMAGSESAGSSVPAEGSSLLDSCCNFLPGFLLLPLRAGGWGLEEALGGGVFRLTAGDELLCASAASMRPCTSCSTTCLVRTRSCELSIAT